MLKQYFLLLFAFSICTTSYIRVSVGNQDNFLLNYAVHMLDEEMKNLDTRFVFGYYPGDHFTLNTPEYQTAGITFLAERYIQWKMRP